MFVITALDPECLIARSSSDPSSTRLSSARSTSPPFSSTLSIVTPAAEVDSAIASVFSPSAPKLTVAASTSRPLRCLLILIRTSAFAPTALLCCGASRSMRSTRFRLAFSLISMIPVVPSRSTSASLRVMAYVPEHCPMYAWSGWS